MGVILQLSRIFHEHIKNSREEQGKERGGKRGGSSKWGVWNQQLGGVVPASGGCGISQKGCGFSRTLYIYTDRYMDCRFLSKLRAITVAKTASKVTREQGPKLAASYVRLNSSSVSFFSSKSIERGGKKDGRSVQVAAF